MYLTESDNIWRLYLEGAAEDMVTNSLKKVNAPQDVVQFFLQKENGKLVFKPEHVATLYDWIKDAGASINSLKSDYQNYQKFFQNTPLNQFKSYLDWTEKVHGKRDEATYQSRHKQIADIELEGQDKENIIENNDEILILRGDDEHKCVRYGKGTGFCISRPGGGNMYGTYRSSKASTFYFIFFKNVPKSDPKHIMVLDHTKNGWEWTFGDNDTQQIEGGWKELVKHFPVLVKYKNKLVKKPLTPEEKKFHRKATEFADGPTLEKFNAFNYQEKAHVLKHGMLIPVDVFDSLDKYLRNEWVSVGPNMTQEIFDKLTTSERERFLKVRKQMIAQQGLRIPFDMIIFNSDTAFKQEMVQQTQDMMVQALQEIRAKAAASNTPIDVYFGMLSEEIQYPYPFNVKFLLNLPDLSDLNGKIRNFHVSGVGLTSLEGLPAGVRLVDCKNNQLTSLKGLPAGVKFVICNNNHLTSLEGLPVGVEVVYCDTNQLTSLEGLPAGVEDVSCKNNQLTSLKGLPASVKKVSCDYNQLISLEGLPAGLERVFCNNNQLTSLKGLPAGVETVHCLINNPGNFTEEDVENAKRGIYTKKVVESTDISKLIKRYLLASKYKSA